MYTIVLSIAVVANGLLFAVPGDATVGNFSSKSACERTLADYAKTENYVYNDGLVLLPENKDGGYSTFACVKLG